MLVENRGSRSLCWNPRTTVSSTVIFSCEYHDSSQPRTSCESGRRSSVANAELWSSTLGRSGRYLHSVSLVQLSEGAFWKDTCAGKCPECIKQSAKTFQIHYDRVRAECSRLAAATGSKTEHWKRPRRESLGGSREGSKSLRSTSTTSAPAESDTKEGTLSELAERLGNFHALTH